MNIERMVDLEVLSLLLQECQNKHIKMNVWLCFIYHFRYYKNRFFKQKFHKSLNCHFYLLWKSLHSGIASIHAAFPLNFVFFRKSRLYFGLKTSQDLKSIFRIIICNHFNNQIQSSSKFCNHNQNKRKNDQM